jgi:hypothetical protein
MGLVLVGRNMRLMTEGVGILSWEACADLVKVDRGQFFRFQDPLLGGAGVGFSGASWPLMPRSTNNLRHK